MKRAFAFKRQRLREVHHYCASRTPSRCGSRVDLVPTPVPVGIRGETIHVFVLNRIGTDVTVRCMDLHGEYTE